MQTSLIHASWKLLQQGMLLKKFNYFPSFLSTIVLNLIILYQVAITWIMMVGGDDFFAFVLSVFDSWLVVIPVAIGCIVLFFLMEFIVYVFEGGLIFLIHTFFRQEGSKYRYGRGFTEGLRNFLPILEYNGVMAFFQPLTLLTSYFFLLRIFGNEYIFAISILMLVYIIIAFIVSILFSYSRFFIILEKQSIFRAISSSVSMALDNIEVTIRLFFSLLLVYVRVVILVIAILLLPVILSAIFTYITSYFFKWVAIWAVGLCYAAFLLFVSHINSVLEIFVQSLWYNVYIRNKQEEAPSPDPK